MHQAPAPVILFTYNRKDTFQNTVEALTKCSLSDKTELFIFSDGPKNKQDEELIKELRDYILQIKGFKKITWHFEERNKGLANSVIEGVSSVFKTKKKAIILEDDLVVSDNFLDYMNECLDFYEENKNIYSISGYSYNFQIPSSYSYDTYFHLRNSSWGWATWSDRWNNCIWDRSYFLKAVKVKSHMNFMGAHCSDLPGMLVKYASNKINSWSIRWTYYQFLNRGYTVYPVISKVKNIGFDERATHTKNEKRYLVEVDKSGKRSFNLSSEIDKDFLKYINGKFKQKFSIGERIRNKVKLHITSWLRPIFS